MRLSISMLTLISVISIYAGQDNECGYDKNTELIVSLKNQIQKIKEDQIQNSKLSKRKLTEQLQEFELAYICGHVSEVNYKNVRYKYGYPDYSLKNIFLSCFNINN